MCAHAHSRIPWRTCLFLEASEEGSASNRLGSKEPHELEQHEGQQWYTPHLLLPS